MWIVVVELQHEDRDDHGQAHDHHGAGKVLSWRKREHQGNSIENVLRDAKKKKSASSPNELRKWGVLSHKRCVQKKSSDEI